MVFFLEWDILIFFWCFISVSIVFIVIGSWNNGAVIVFNWFIVHFCLEKKNENFTQNIVWERVITKRSHPVQLVFERQLVDERHILALYSIRCPNWPDRCKLYRIQNKHLNSLEVDSILVFRGKLFHGLDCMLVQEQCMTMVWFGPLVNMKPLVKLYDCRLMVQCMR